MPLVLVLLAAGVILLLAGIWKGAYTQSRKGFWLAAPGTVLVVMAVFFLAGFNGTAYYPSCTDLQSSLTIRNSSSSRFTLQVMFWVSLLIPFVVAYIAYAWHAMDRKKITAEEIETTDDKY
jgi:cytochrome d ubiquinol oxidase subunit II